MFEFGDKVWSTKYGLGVVAKIDRTTMPIGVMFKNLNNMIWYYEDGKTCEDKCRTLFFNKISISSENENKKIEKEILEECKENN